MEGTLLIINLVFATLMIIAMWKVFTKAGQPGWAILIPVFNAYVMLKIADKPGWWLILMFIPIVNMVVSIMVIASLAENFGRDAWFTLGLIFLPFIFYSILAFGRSEYQYGRQSQYPGIY